jgi:hypothetical protein
MMKKEVKRRKREARKSAGEVVLLSVIPLRIATASEHEVDHQSC